MSKYCCTCRADNEKLRGIIGLTYTQDQVDALIANNTEKILSGVIAALQNAGGINTEYHIERIEKIYR